MENIPSNTNFWHKITLVIFIMSGIFLSVGGIWLATLGGSIYYVIAGITFIFVAVLYWMRSSNSIMLMAAFLFATIFWGLWESGSDFWALAPRYDIVFLLSLWLILPFAKSRFYSQAKYQTNIMSVGLFSTLLILGYALFNDPQEINGIVNNPVSNKTSENSTGKDWKAYGGTQSGSRYSSLSQINTDNVESLREIWRFQTGDVKRGDDPGELTNEVTPLKVDDTLYLCTSHQQLFALNAATGKKKWMFDPKIKYDATFQHMTCRGVSYYEKVINDPEQKNSLSLDPCQNKVFLPTNDGHLYAVDPKSGELCEKFGDNGAINLQANMPHNYPGGYEPTSPPVVTHNMIIIGGAVTDNYSTREPSGVIRGYDVNTGKMMWVFDTGAEAPNKIPGPGENFTPNSPNSWAPSSYDPELDIIYIPTGVSTPDIWGGHRLPNMERYANSILALNATTGKLVWAYRTVHHDLWDMDVPSQPTLANVKGDSGEVVPVVYVPTKTGNIFVLDRRNGKLVVPAPERPVPQKPAKGDFLSPTQPFSALTYRPKENLSDKNMWGGTMFDQMVCRIMFHRLRYEGIFTPPSEQGTLVFPGNLGMFEWGGISVNQDRQIALANPMALPFVSTLIPRNKENPMWPPKEAQHGTGTEAGIQPQYGIPYGVKLGPFLSPLGIPCKEPSWGYISAFDMKTNEIVWKKRVGTIRDSVLGTLGIQLPPLKIGMPMLGGPMSTAGNLMFLGATQDNYIRAFNVENGDKLWQARLPAGGQATPMTYEINGRQYVVISAGGHGSFGTTMGDYIVAYALPDEN
jgi:quinoprotein glucose dehydrogenase